MRIPTPRLLPITIAAMVALLALKSANLVLAAIPPAPAPASQEAPPAAKPEPATAAKPPEPPTPTPPAEPAISAEERALLLDLRHRNAELAAREATLNSREAVLAAAEKRLGLRVDELTALQHRLESLEADRKARDDANWQSLVKVYETMKPHDAAVIFNDLDKPVLLQVLSRMKEGRAAPILAAMQPDRARTVTTELASLRLKENQVPSAPPPKGPK